MAVTTTAPNKTSSALRTARRTVTFDNAYVTGGEPLAASAFGMKRIHSASAVVRAGIAVAAHVDPLVQTDGSLLLRLRVAAGTEVASAADASTVVVDVVALGY